MCAFKPVFSAALLPARTEHPSRALRLPLVAQPSWLCGSLWGRLPARRLRGRCHSEGRLSRKFPHCRRLKAAGPKNLSFLFAGRGKQASSFQAIQISKAFELNTSRFGYLSAKDRLLLQDALSLECDAFLTLDRRLAKNSKHISREVGLQVFLPAQLWGVLRPWARLFV